jgi:hypothetical protein
MTIQTRLASVVLALVLAVAALTYILPSRAPDDPAVPAGALTPPDAADATAPALTVYFSRGDSAVAVQRITSGAAGPEAALRELLKGPTAAERGEGFASWFSPETAGLLRSFVVDTGGIAHVDFGNLDRVIPGASSSAGSGLLLQELNGTLFQYPEIQAIEYSIAGSCDAFWNWLQYDCELVRREGTG